MDRVNNQVKWRELTSKIYIQTERREQKVRETKPKRKREKKEKETRITYEKKTSN